MGVPCLVLFACVSLHCFTCFKLCGQMSGFVAWFYACLQQNIKYSQQIIDVCVSRVVVFACASMHGSMCFKLCAVKIQYLFRFYMCLYNKSIKSIKNSQQSYELCLPR